MKNHLLLLTIFSLLLAIKQGTAEVVSLTAGTFEHQTQAATGATTGNWFVMFFAPWCGHCKRLKPTWSETAQALAEQEDASYTTLATVDCTVEKSVCERFAIRSYPTLLFFHQGKMAKYEKKRSKESLLEFVNGGFSELMGSEQATDVPKEVSWFEKFMNTMRQDFYDMVKYRKTFLAFLVVASISFGIFLGWCLENIQGARYQTPTPIALRKVSVPADAASVEKKDASAAADHKKNE